jgi:hypothetical protein
VTVTLLEVVVDRVRARVDTEAGRLLAQGDDLILDRRRDPRR